MLCLPFQKYKSLCPRIQRQMPCTCSLSNVQQQVDGFNDNLVAITFFPKLLRTSVKSVGEGYKTNHSLRVSAATRFYKAGIDEQLIMERTSHQSLDGVRTTNAHHNLYRIYMNYHIHICHLAQYIQNLHEDYYILYGILLVP